MTAPTVNAYYSGVENVIGKNMHVQCLADS